MVRLGLETTKPVCIVASTNDSFRTYRSVRLDRQVSDATLSTRHDTPWIGWADLVRSSGFMSRPRHHAWMSRAQGVVRECM